MNTARVLTVLAFVLMLELPSYGQWLTGYAYRKEMTVAAGDITGTGTLSDFPLLVSYTSADLDNSTGHVQSTDGFDITFADATGNTEVPFQLVSFDGATGSIVAWVQLDLDGTSGTTFYMYYGNASETTDQSSATTWNTNYIGVWPLDETTSSAGATYRDLTSNANDATDNGATTNTTGKVGNAQVFGENKWLEVPDDATLKAITTAFTYSAWVQPDAAGQNDDAGVIIKNNTGAAYNQHLGVESTDRPSIRVRTNTGNDNIGNNTIVFDINDNTQWYHMVLVYDGTDVRFYGNGGTAAGGMQYNNARDGNVTTHTEPLLIGRRASDDDRFFDGIIDEVRYLGVALTEDWIATEYNNQNDPTTFITVSAEEASLLGGTASATPSTIGAGSTTTISLSGHTTTGTTLQWQSSTDNVNFVDVSDGSGATTSTYTTGALTTNTYFRCVVDDGGGTANSSSALVTVLGASDWLSGFNYRKQLTVDAADISGTGSLTGFPLLVQVTSTDLNNTTGHVTSVNGFDIAFTNGGGVTELPFELVSFDGGAGTVVAWVKMDLDGATGNSFFMYYGNSGITTDQSGSDTWSGDYLGVWPLDEATSSAGAIYEDLTANNNDATDNGATTNVVGKVGNAQVFGENKWLQVPDAASLKDITNAFTFQAWIKTTGQDDDAGVILKSNGSDHNQHLGIEDQERPSIRVRTNVGGTENVTNTTIPFDTNDDLWHRIVYVYDGTNMIFYGDDTAPFTRAKTGNVETHTEPLLIGRRGIGDNRFFDGTIDEVRYLKVALTQDWILTEYGNQNNPGSFVAAATEEIAVFGGTAVASPDEIVSGSATTITLSGHTTAGTTLQWQSSTDGVNFSNVSDGFGALTDTYTTGNLTVNTYFRCVVDNGDVAANSTAALVSIIASFNSGEGPTGYSLRRKITVDATEVAGAAPHVNFPFLVRLTGTELISDLRYSSNGGDVSHPLGYDIIFTQADGLTELDHQIEAYDPSTGAYVAWVDIPSLSHATNTEIYMYYGNGSVNTNPSTGIFDTDYVGVWHLHDQYDDATANGNDGIGFGAVTNSAGIIGNAADFEPAGNQDFSRIALGTFDADQVSITLSTWAYKDPTYDGVEDGRLISKTLSTAQDDHTFMLGINNFDQYRVRLTGTEVDGSGAETISRNEDENWADGVWKYLAFTWTSNSDLILYEDGVEIWRTANLNDRERIEQTAVAKVAIGNNSGAANDGDPGNRRPFDGLIDEMRIANIVRSEDWLRTEYNNQRINQTFYTLDDEEGCNVRGGNTAATDPIIFNGEQTAITLSDELGSTIQWQSSLDNVTFVDLVGENGQTYLTGSLSATTYYRAVVTDGTCSATSSITTVTVEERFLSNYAYRKEIIINPDKVAGTSSLEDFPVLVDLTDPDLATSANGGNVFDTDASNGSIGDDITFTNGSGSELTYYREAYDDVNGRLVAWVKIPLLSATQPTSFYIYYGNCKGIGLPNVFNTNTWNNDDTTEDYDAVWLMNDTTPTTISDATVNSRDATGTGLVFTTGQISAAVDLEAGDGNDKVTYSNYTTSGTVLTVSAWINAESLLNPNVGADTDDAIIMDHNDFQLKTFVANLGPDENQTAFEVTTTNGTVAATSLPSDLDAGTPIMVTGVYDGGQVAIYENGNFVASETQTGNLAGSTSDIVLGNNAANGLPYDGVLDHVTIVPAARSSDWIKTMYNNQSNPSDFYEYSSGDQESQITWVGGATGAENDFANAQNWSTCATPQSDESVAIPGGLADYPILLSSVEIDDIILETGSSFDLNGQTLTVHGRFTNNGTFTHGNGTVVFSGIENEQISGSSGVTFYDLTINSASNEVTVEMPVIVENTLTLQSGYMAISDDQLSLTDNGEISGGDANTFFITDGSACLQQQGLGGARSGVIAFPVGIGTSSYTPVTIDNIGTGDAFCIRVANKVYSEGETGTGFEVTTDAIAKTWFVDEDTDGGSNVTMTLQWNAADELPGFDRTDMIVSHFTGGGWLKHGSGLVATNPASNVYMVSVSGVDGFSPQSGSSGSTVLPVELLTFEGWESDGAVQLQWTTATEIDNDYFTLYRSGDGQAFEEIARIPGAGNSEVPVAYSFSDRGAKEGFNYYRLRQTDFDGQFEDFRVIVVEVNGLNSGPSLLIYPNPSDGNVQFVADQLPPATVGRFEIFDAAGRPLQSLDVVTSENGVFQYHAEWQGSPGLYTVRLTVGEHVLSSHLILR